MIIIGVCILVGFVLGLTEDLISACFVAFLAGVCGFLVAMAVGLIVYSGSERVTHTMQLESLVDGSDSRGAFFLGSGTINDVSMFTWYEQPTPGSYRQEQAEAYMSTVHFIAGDERPYYQRTDKVYKYGFLQLWGVNLNANDGYVDEYHFYVPKGTIKHTYELDAQ